MPGRKTVSCALRECNKPAKEGFAFCTEAHGRYDCNVFDRAHIQKMLALGMPFARAKCRRASNAKFILELWRNCVRFATSVHKLLHGCVRLA
jgi:hypothetical protein